MAQTTRNVGGTEYIVHRVTSGETLYKLSKKYDVSVAEIKTANGNSDQINLGQELLIPTKAVSKVETANSTHVVSSGETLSKIAKDNGVTVDELKTWNNLTSSDIKIGQKLIIKKSAQTTEPVVAKVEDKEPAVKETVTAKPKTKEPSVKEAETKPNQDKSNGAMPDNPRKSSGSQINKGEQTGIPESTEIVLAETATEKEEIASARVIETGMDQTRTFVKHPSLPKGSIIVVINETTGKMAYCRVIDNVKTNELKGATLAITKAVADKIGLKSELGDVKIKYAAP